MLERQLSQIEALTSTWSTAVETMQAFAPHFQEGTIAATADLAPHWFFIVIAMAGEPEPLTLDRLQAIFPYNDRKALVDALQPHVDDGYLAPADGAASGYCATEKGRRLVQSFYNAAHEGLRDVSPLPAAEMEQLRDLLQRIVHNIDSPLSPSVSIFHVGRTTGPGPEGGVAAHIDQYLTDLYYYRDDAHIASWQSSGLDGIAWETLTFIWREQARTARELAQELSTRLLDEEDYSAALKRLAERGLIFFDGEQAQLTAEGRRLRQDAEVRTDELFFAPWQALDVAEQEKLHDLLRRTRDSLRIAARRRMWPLLNDVATALQLPAVRVRVRPVIEERLNNRAVFNHLRMAREAQPDAYSLNRFLTRAPYANGQRALEFLQEAAENGYVQETGVGQFMLTPKGEDVVDAANDAFYGALAEVEVLPDEDMTRLNELLEKLVQAAFQSDAPSKACLRQTYDTALPRDYAPLAQVDLHIDDLNAFRDDAHISAWAANYAGGRDWEAFTLIWRGEARTAAELAEQLSFRGWTVAGYQKSLDTLADRGWLQLKDGFYTVTAAGEQLRRDIEERTDDVFYASWDDALTTDEENELRRLLIRLKLQLLHLAETGREASGSAV